MSGQNRLFKGAVEYLGWLPDPSVPNDQIHNPVTERKIRSIKEAARAVQLKSGLPHQFWPRSVEYVCTALAVSTNAAIHPNDSDDVKNLKATQNAYEAASGGDAFTGLKLPFGCLVFYKPPKHRELPDFEPRTYPGIFVGWRIDAGYKFRGIHLVLDFESLRKNTQGCGKPIQVYETELVEPSNGHWVFPLFEAEQQRLQLFSAKSTPTSISTRKALPFDDEVPDPVPRRKRTYVTLERAIKFGRTPGCKGCERISEGVPHSDACHDRFRVLLEDERLAQEAKAKAREEAAARGIPMPPTPASRGTPVPRTPGSGPAPSTPVPPTPAAVITLTQRTSEATDAPGTTAVDSCHNCSFQDSKNKGPRSDVKGAKSLVEDNSETKDYWEFDEARHAWVLVHLRPRKRLFAPVGKDCPFDSNEVEPERITEWRCKGKVSVHRDNWQETPYQRISSKSWFGKTWFFPKGRVSPDQAQLCAAAANPSDGNLRAMQRFIEQAGDSQARTRKAREILELTKDLVKPAREDRKGRTANPTLFEFCCDENSTLGQINEERGINHFRLTTKNSDMSSQWENDSLLKVMEQFPGCDLWGSIPCGPWSQWQNVNLHQYGKPFAKKLKKMRKHSRKILANYIRCADKVLSQGGHVAFEWPKTCAGWDLPELIRFVKRHDLFVAEPQGCAFGLCDQEGKCHLKTWRVVTSSWRLAKNLDSAKCQHPRDYKHSPLAGSKTPRSAFYPMPMARCISQSLYPWIDAPPATPAQVSAGPNSVQEFLCGDHAPENEVGHQELPGVEHVFAGIHKLLERKEWGNFPGAQDAIDNEVNGLVANGTWTFDEVISKEDLLARCKKNKEHINIASLMTILSIKRWETPELRKLKARIVFRGDHILTEDNLAVLQEAKVTPTGMTGVNINLAYGAIKGHETRQSDVVKAYTQAYLGTKVPTWVILPWELTPPEYRHFKQPCVRLVRSLYGHPESGYHWDQRLREVMKLLEGQHVDEFPSSFWFPQRKLLVTCYVDDILCSGPSSEQNKFWQEIEKHLEIEPPTQVERVLGRQHKFDRTNGSTKVSLEMFDFIKNACAVYEDLAQCKLSTAKSPFCPEGSLTTADFESKGVLATSACKILMKILWCARLSRPDLMKGIGDLTRRITTWSRADDKRLHRLMCYLYGSKGYTLQGHIGDPPELLKLCLYTDADHCSGIEHTKSTSGMFLSIEGPNTLWPIAWGSKRQTATARSTTAAEMISLGSGLFGEALPAQGFLELILDRQVTLECFQDNSAVIQIVAAGYSPKLRHLTKTEKIELGSAYEVFEDPSCKLLYIATDKQRADVFTKPLPVCKWDHALDLLNMASLSSTCKVPSREAETLRDP